MSNVDYSYEIVLVDPASKCMVVTYTAEGFAPMQIGVRLPYEGEDVEAVIRQYAPVNLWAVKNAPVVVPVAGVKGTFNASAPPSLEEQIAVFDAALVTYLDATARERRYDNRVTCALRAGYPGPFQAEGIAFAAWMDKCNALAYSLLAEVVAGTRPMPDSPQALIDLMPAIEWPEGAE